MITTVTLNPMLDKTVSVDGVRRGAVSRASGVSMVVGGKGVNVSRQLRRLGEETVATGFVGGEIGSMLERLLDGEGIPHSFVRIAGMTREGVTYLEPDGTMTSVFEPPGRVTAPEAEHLLEECRALAGNSDWVVCSGSSPSPEAAPYVNVGDTIGIGQVLCIIEAMKLMNEIKSEVRGKILEILVDNAEPVEFGQVIFVIEPIK